MWVLLSANGAISLAQWGITNSWILDLEGGLTNGSHVDQYRFLSRQIALVKTGSRPNTNTLIHLINIYICPGLKVGVDIYIESAGLVRGEESLLHFWGPEIYESFAEWAGFLDRSAKTLFWQESHPSTTMHGENRPLVTDQLVEFARVPSSRLRRKLLTFWELAKYGNNMILRVGKIWQHIIGWTWKHL